MASTGKDPGRAQSLLLLKGNFVRTTACDVSTDKEYRFIGKQINENPELRLIVPTYILE